MMASYWLIIMIYPDSPLFAVAVEFIIPASQMVRSRCDDFGCVVFHSVAFLWVYYIIYIDILQAQA